MAEADFNNPTSPVVTGPENETFTYDPYSQRAETYIVPVLFVLILFVGFIGNGTLIMIFVRHRVMRNVPNTNILCLAVGDLLVIVFTVPFVTTIYTVESWPWGVSICKLSVVFMDISIGVSVFTLTVFTVERYCAIVNPIKRHLCTKSFTLKLLIILIWTLSILVATPAMVFTNLRELRLANRTIALCSLSPEHLPEYYAKRIVIFTCLAYYMIPLFIIACFCTLMARHLVPSAYSLPGEQDQKQSSQIKARKKVAKMIVTIDIIFAICLMPQHIFSLWFHFNPNAMGDFDDFWNVFRIIGYCLSFINFCSKPIVLYFVSKTFRRYINHYLFLCVSSSKKFIDIGVNEADSSSPRQNSINTLGN